MSKTGSVEASKIKTIVAKSIISSHGSASLMSRVSSKSSSLPGFKNTEVSHATSQLIDIISSKISIDEYGFTNKTCRNCSSFLSVEEIIALAIPLDNQGKPLCIVEDINFEEISLICLSCYAE